MNQGRPRSSIVKRRLALFSGTNATALALLLGLGLSLPALGSGLIVDDYFQRTIHLGVGIGAGSRPIFDLYSFLPVGPRRDLLHELGVLSWWTDPHLRAELFRPLSALTFVADYALWPNDFFLQHLHSLLWFGVAVLVVACFYRQVHGAGTVAGLAALLFAVGDAHAMPVGWLANRHALLSLVFGMAAVEAHRRWCTGARTIYGMAAALPGSGIASRAGGVQLSRRET